MTNKSPLKNYCHIVQELESIKNSVVILRNVTTHIMNNTKSKKAKKLVYSDFEEKLDQIKNDTSKRYQYLKTEKMKLERDISLIDKSINNDFVDELRLINMFDSVSTKNISKNISSMSAKYTKLPTNKESPQYSDIYNGTNRIIKLRT
jgi:hypothetical protein